jgi:CHASE2 domain-containing sensor protein
MSADNYSYGILRWTIIFLFGLVIFIAGSFQSKINLYMLIVCWVIASLFLLRCYAISHYPVKPKTIFKFFYFGQAYANWEKQIKDAMNQK